MNFGNTVAKIQQKYEREREKVGERVCMNFGNVITGIPTARSAYPSVCAVCCVLEVGCAKKKKKHQLWQYHCRNRGRKKNFVAIVALHCRNRG